MAEAEAKVTTTVRLAPEKFANGKRMAKKMRVPFSHIVELGIDELSKKEGRNP